MKIEYIHQSFKSIIDQYSFLSRDVLHVYLGVLFIFLFRVFIPKIIGIYGIVILSILAIINEILDLMYFHERTGTLNWTESFSDIFNTLFLPIILLQFLKFKQKSC